MALRVRIRKYERGLWFEHGDLKGVLAPGKHWLWSTLIKPRASVVERVSILRSKFEHELLEVITREPSLASELIVLDLASEQRALVWGDGRLLDILGPGRHAYWREPLAIEVETFDVNERRFVHEKLETILEHPRARYWLEGVEVPEHEAVLLSVNGKLVERLGEGKHVLWKGTGSLKFQTVELREQLADVAGQEIMTSDKVTLRVNLVVAYQIVDPERAVTRVPSADQALYREAQLALRAAIGTRTLDDLLSDKESVGGHVASALANRAAEFGVQVRSVGLRDIILPGEMKTILNRVIEAQKQAEADLIKRREETASARSQANTARLLAENPTLARLKELEMLQGVLAGTKATFVLARGDLMEQVSSLVSREAMNGNAAPSNDA